MIGAFLLAAGAAADASAQATLTVDRPVPPTYSIGEAPVYTLTGAPPNATIYWSSTKNGQPTGETNQAYCADPLRQFPCPLMSTDSNGNFTVQAGPWPSGSAGGWVKQATVNGVSASVFMQVQSMSLAVDRPAPSFYTTGEATVYTITGAPPNAAVYWTSTLNGRSTGETNQAYCVNPQSRYPCPLVSADSNGNLILTGGPWTAGNAGAWVKKATINGISASVALTVGGADFFSANGTQGSITIPYGGSVTLAWNSSNASACTLNGAAVAVSSTAVESGLTAPVTYTLACTGPNGLSTRALIVDVVPPSAGLAAPAPTVGDIKAYPNPLRAGEAAMNFKGGPPNADLKIYTLTGALVKELSADSSGSASWDGTNKAGQMVANEVYFVLARSAGAHRTFKVMVQR